MRWAASFLRFSFGVLSIDKCSWNFTNDLHVGVAMSGASSTPVSCCRVRALFSTLQIDQRSFYLRNGLKAEFRSDLDLDGVGATWERELRFDDHAENPLLEKTHSIHLPELSAKFMGLFVVDLVGAGLRSRLVLQKGSLQLISHRVEGGAFVGYVVGPDATLGILKTARVLVEASGQWLEADKETGRFVIPHKALVDPKSVKVGGAPTGDNTPGGSGAVRLLLVHENLAIPAVLQNPAEKFFLECRCHLLEESLTESTTARVLVAPVLTSTHAGTLPDVARVLKNAEVRVSMTALSAEGVALQVQRVFKDPTASTTSSGEVDPTASLFQNSGTAVVSFLVPPRLSNLSIEVVGSVWNRSTQKMDPVQWTSSSTKNITNPLNDT